MKTCTKCEQKYPATTEYFSPEKRTKIGLQSRCKVCIREYARKYAIKYYYKHRNRLLEQNRKRAKDRYATFDGYVGYLISSIKTRCGNPKVWNYNRYGGKGISLEFTKQELLNWLPENGIDPRGLQIHRKDNNKNYTLGNIEFLTASKHTALHNKERVK